MRAVAAGVPAAPVRGVDHPGGEPEHAFHAVAPDAAMNPPVPRQPSPTSPTDRADEEQIRRWLKLRRELTELHARLEYLKLMMNLGVSQ